MHCEFCFHRKLKTAKAKPNNRAMDEDLLLVEINGNDSGDSSSDRSYIPGYYICRFCVGVAIMIFVASTDNGQRGQSQAAEPTVSVSVTV